MKQCIGCDVKETAEAFDVEQLIEEQLALELDLASADVVESRVAICKTCPFRLEETCGKCGCYYRFRANLANKECPVKRWK